jgi:methionine biosynthesis protein MetW
MTVLRADLAHIAAWIPPNARVLDLGCGDGALLHHLASHQGVSGFGVEIDDDKVRACVAKGVNVIQADLESGLQLFESASFDCVILSQTLQAMRNTETIVSEMLRVGRQGIVSFPNFGYWFNRWQILLGRMPVSDSLPYQWYDTPNVHLCTLDDFSDFCHHQGARIVEQQVMHNSRVIQWGANWRGSIAVFRFEKAAD